MRHQPEKPNDRPLILLTGATGDVGGRLLKVLEHRGYRVRCLARHPAFPCAHIGPETELVAGDILDPTTRPSAVYNVQVAYYRVDSMGSTGAFEAENRQAADNGPRELCLARRTYRRRIVSSCGDGPCRPERALGQGLGRALTRSAIGRKAAMPQRPRPWRGVARARRPPQLAQSGGG